MLVAVITGPSKKEIEAQIQKASIHAHALEFRLDCFTDPFNLNDFVLSLRVIFTLRSISQGGNCQESEEKRLQKIMQLASFHPDFIDLEETVPKSFIEELKKQYPKIKIILSYHDFKETPKDLEAVLQRMQEKKTDFYKMAFYANSSLDALQMLQFLKTTEKNVIGLCMGTYGTITRILNHWTFAYVDTPSAPGQLSLDELVHDYKFSSSKRDSIFGLVGNPVEKSISHITHNAFFEKKKINAAYIKMAIKKEELEQFLQKIKKSDFKGLSVTMPLKEAILPYLDRIDEKARAIEAVNTVFIQDGKLIGSNTDAEGALLALEEKTTIKNKRVILLGAGGAAKAIAFQAIKKGAFVTILNRNEEKAVQCAKQLGCEG
ncbi:MAG TPA: type I 3-dehydroquinate dehydratase, partial [Parachlamydiaceae bacterium]|nr:type I 3-dehydroquinate dehydratase [Parachlamydiaceae bacterium]